MKYFILLFFCLAFTALRSQEKVVLTKPQDSHHLVLKSMKNIDIQNEKIVDMAYDKVTKKLYYFYSTDTDSIIYDQNEKYSTIVSKCGIITEDGIKISFNEPNIEVLYLSNNEIIIDTRDRNSNSSLIKKYSIKNNTLTLLKEVSFKSFELNYRQVDNYTIMSDDVEGVGSCLEVYNTDLAKVKYIRPFSGHGYLESFLLSNEQNLLNISHSYQNPDSLQFILFDKKFNEIRRFNVWLDNLRILFVKSIEDKVFISAQTLDRISPQPILLCYDFTGKLLWKNTFRFPFGHKNIDLVKSANTLWGFIYSGRKVNNLYKIDIKTGKIMSEMNLDSFYALNAGEVVYSKYRGLLPFVFELTNDHAMSLLLGDCSVASDDQVECKCNPIVYVEIDPESQSVMVEKLPVSSTDIRHIRFYHDSNSLIFTFTNKILRYETH